MAFQLNLWVAPVARNRCGEAARGKSAIRPGILQSLRDTGCKQPVPPEGGVALFKKPKLPRHSSEKILY
jgi:hypothetical protein